MCGPADRPAAGPVLTFALIAIGVGVGAYPVVRRLTRRLERLQAGVTEWGAGNLPLVSWWRGVMKWRSWLRRSTRRRPASSNSSARTSHCSRMHRTNCGRRWHAFRLGVELLPRIRRRRDAPNSRATSRELDQLIDEILLASRLKVARHRSPRAVEVAAVVA